MLIGKRLRIMWCLLICGVLLLSTPYEANRLDHFIGINNMNSWAHFLAYAVVSTIPVAAWKHKTDQLLSLILSLVGITLELTPVFIQGAIMRPQNASADMFGVGAGILLGLNLRMMSNSVKPINEAGQNPSHSTLI